MLPRSLECSCSFRGHLLRSLGRQCVFLFPPSCDISLHYFVPQQDSFLNCWPAGSLGASKGVQYNFIMKWHSISADSIHFWLEGWIFQKILFSSFCLLLKPHVWIFLAASTVIGSQFSLLGSFPPWLPWVSLFVNKNRQDWVTAYTCVILHHWRKEGDILTEVHESILSRALSCLMVDKCWKVKFLELAEAPVWLASSSLSLSLPSFFPFLLMSRELFCQIVRNLQQTGSPSPAYVHVCVPVCAHLCMMDGGGGENVGRLQIP